MSGMEQKTTGDKVPPTPRERLEKAEELRPVPYGVSHQDSLFTNSYQAKPYFVVHPEWNSEVVSDCMPLPMNRPPWPWEQPRYRVNMQIPITYKSEAEEIQEETQGDGAGTPTPATQPAWDYSQEVPPLSYHLSRAYRSTLPQYVVRY